MLSLFDPRDEPLADEAGTTEFDWPIRRAIVASRTRLLSEQQPDGRWAGDAQGAAGCEAQRILLAAYVGELDRPVLAKFAQHLLDTQLEDGGWPRFAEGPADASTSIQAYFALKLLGHEPCTEPMARARATILAFGGAAAANTLTRYLLALLGQIPYDACPVAPAELMLLPRWSPLSVAAMNPAAQNLFVPLSIVSALRPVCRVDAEHGVRELFLSDPRRWPPAVADCDRAAGLLSWDRWFCFADRCAKFIRQRGWNPVGRRGAAAAEQWLIEHTDGSDDGSNVSPELLMWRIVALCCLGHDGESSDLQRCFNALDLLTAEDEHTAHVRPARSPVDATALALWATTGSGLSRRHSGADEAADWLIERMPGDSGQAAEVMIALGEHLKRLHEQSPTLPPGLRLTLHVHDEIRIAKRRRSALEERLVDALLRGGCRLLAEQNRDGGWATFARDGDRRLLRKVPFVEPGALVDPSMPEVTGCALEALAAAGHRTGTAAIDRAVEYLRTRQQADGSWPGQGHHDQIRATWRVLSGLRAVGLTEDDPAVAAGAAWLAATQHTSGGWGEFSDTSISATATQTAWALLGLMAAGRGDRPAAVRAARFLAVEHRDNGAWQESAVLDEGILPGSSIGYDLGCVSYPLAALVRWAREAPDSNASLPAKTLAAEEGRGDGCPERFTSHA